MPVGKMAEEAFLQLGHTGIVNQMDANEDLFNTYMAHTNISIPPARRHSVNCFIT